MLIRVFLYLYFLDS